MVSDEHFSCTHLLLHKKKNQKKTNKQKKNKQNEPSFGNTLLEKTDLDDVNLLIDLYVLVIL